ncbi:MAG: glycosyltransferase family 4 protein [Anaerolineae bacterium]|jgi:glycosyltransferase involved in cell wall biosynthesis|nr:glycosyltransferase family 4 protein [Anaerolineae bacterium]
MKILVVLTYYRPHTSGLTIYAERLARAMAQRGHQVTILTSQYLKELPREEVMDGIRVVRAPVLLRINKGVIMPTFGFLATRLVLENDVIHLHLPQFDAAGLAIRGRLFRKPTVVTYHCDLLLPKGFINWLVNQAVHLMNRITGIFTHRIVAYTRDYAEHSPFISKFTSKLEVINPPVIISNVQPEEVKQFKVQFNGERRIPVIGMAARFATEKGVEVLLNAAPEIIKRYPRAVFWFAGPYENIIGEEKYYERLKPRIELLQNNGQWKFLGLLSPRSMAAFYPNLDVLVIPSLNSTESFGLVQIEAMMSGVPSIASDLPGVRQPVLRHKMGRVIPIGDSGALAQAVTELIAEKKEYGSTPKALRELYAPDTIAQEYEQLFERIKTEIK